MKLDELRCKCAQILLDGGIHFDDEGTLSVNLTEEDKEIFVEYVVNQILTDALNALEAKDS